jgi:dihydropyrimidine dehydrogenase (NADP+)/dihydropyrimidine dehydrogenase (NAD+) subunit PreA
MKVGYRCVRAMLDELSAFMDQHGFQSLADFRGHSLQYFTTHSDLVHRQSAARQSAARQAAVERDARAAAQGAAAIRADHQWSGADFVKQSDALARG